MLIFIPAGIYGFLGPMLISSKDTVQVVIGFVLIIGAIPFIAAAFMSFWNDPLIQNLIKGDEKNE